MFPFHGEPLPSRHLLEKETLSEMPPKSPCYTRIWGIREFPSPSSRNCAGTPLGTFPAPRRYREWPNSHISHAWMWFQDFASLKTAVLEIPILEKFHKNPPRPRCFNKIPGVFFGLWEFWSWRMRRKSWGFPSLEGSSFSKQTGEREFQE